MNRDDYIKTRNTSHIDINLFYKYYCENCNNREPISLQVFNQTFTIYIKLNSKLVFKYLDSVFKVNTIYDKTGNLIKVL